MRLPLVLCHLAYKPHISALLPPLRTIC
uniref:Uncharacterized protein n=1 Tax=Arundo donax TaxID=35708 RepID=A0A0A9MWV1_ARUDO